MFGAMPPGYPKDPPKQKDEKPNKPAPEPDQRLDERYRIILWRMACLYDAGYPMDYAELMARDQEIDYHKAIDVLQACKDVERALSIVL